LCRTVDHHRLADRWQLRCRLDRVRPCAGDAEVDRIRACQGIRFPDRGPQGAVPASSITQAVARFKIASIPDGICYECTIRDALRLDDRLSRSKAALDRTS
jgi:hypothetical protein